MGLLDRLFSPSEGEQSDEQKKLASHVREKVEESRNSAARLAHESVWMENTAALCGFDGLKFDSRTRRYVPVDTAVPYTRKNRQMNVNMILPAAQNRLARLCKNPPKYDVRPESGDPQQKDAARLAQQVLTCLWEKLSIDQKRLVLFMWVQQCGHGWVKICWDPLLGDLMENPENGECSFQGDVRADIVSPFEIYPDPLAKTPDEVRQSWIIQCKVRKIDYFRENYPEYGHLVKEEDTWLLSAQYESSISSLSSKSGGGFATPEALKNTAIEMIKYEARSLKHPKGRMIIVANGVLLADKELPVGIIPFAQFCDTIVAGKLYPESVITHSRPIQNQNNENLSRRSEHLRKIIHGKIIAARDCGLKQEQINDQLEIVFYSPVPNAPNGGKPEAMAMPTLPQYTFESEDRSKAQLNDVFGVQEIDKGNLEQAGMPALGMQIITENSDTRISVVTTQHEGEWSYVGKLILKHVEKFYSMPRKIKMAGPNMTYIVKEITGSDLKGSTDVIVKPGSTQPGSKSLKRQEIINMHQSGYFGPTSDPQVIEKVLKSIEFGDVNEAWIDQGLDMRQIRMGIELLEAGESPEINDFDNHALWIQELNRYRKSEKWDAMDETRKQLLIALMDAHAEALLTMTGAMPAEPPAPLEPMPLEPAPEGAPMPMAEGDVA